MVAAIKTTILFLSIVFTTACQPYVRTNITTYHDKEKAPGIGIHEMGTARMGRDKRTSVLNGFNQAHDIPNLFVTDGACMTSTAVQNPSITYMALTARAVDYAVTEIQNGRI